MSSPKSRKPPRAGKWVPQYTKGEHSKPVAPPALAQPSFDDLVDRHRDRTLDLEARGYLPNAICSIIRAPYKVVEHILSTKAAPKKKGAPK